MRMLGYVVAKLSVMGCTTESKDYLKLVKFYTAVINRMEIESFVMRSAQP